MFGLFPLQSCAVGLNKQLCHYHRVAYADSGWTKWHVTQRASPQTTQTWVTSWISTVPVEHTSLCVHVVMSSPYSHSHRRMNQAKLTALQFQCLYSGQWFFSSFWSNCPFNPLRHFLIFMAISLCLGFQLPVPSRGLFCFAYHKD